MTIQIDMEYLDTPKLTNISTIIQNGIRIQ